MSVRVAPAGMNDAAVAAVKGGPTNSGIGVVPGPKTRLFRPVKANPGPNSATLVNVCVLPPVLTTAKSVPGEIESCPGANLQPPAWLLAVSCEENVSKPKPSPRTQAPGRMAASNVAVSHLSLMSTVRVAGSANAADATTRPTTSATAAAI